MSEENIGAANFVDVLMFPQNDPGVGEKLKIIVVEVALVFDRLVIGDVDHIITIDLHSVNHPVQNNFAVLEGDLEFLLAPYDLGNGELCTIFWRCFVEGCLLPELLGDNLQILTAKSSTLRFVSL